METDYYLHNFHVKTGRGTLQSMKGFQMAFGVVDWNDDDDTDIGNEKDSVVSGQSLHVRRSHHRAHSRSSTLNSIESAVYRQEDQSRRIQKVRNRCNIQNQALSNWWKIAIQANIQQRMWMQLGNSPVESMVPPRFERLYQPEKMAQFDRFFARPWATPVRRSHSAQHSAGPDDENDIAEFRRNITGRPLVSEKASLLDQSAAYDDSQEINDLSSSLEQFVADYGFESQNERSLKMFVEHHDAPSNTEISGMKPCFLLLCSIRPI
jgi:hypothetical protein